MQWETSYEAQKKGEEKSCQLDGEKGNNVNEYNL
jgi:hypothetical protein